MSKPSDQARREGWQTSSGFRLVIGVENAVLARDALFE
jgi:hypothetical protein